MMSVWLQELTSDDVEAYLEREATIIVPIGATETHGPHLPLGTDTYEAMDYAEAIATKAGVLCAPPIWFGDSPHHMGRPGTISLRSTTVIAVGVLQRAAGREQVGEAGRCCRGVLRSRSLDDDQGEQDGDRAGPHAPPDLAIALLIHAVPPPAQQSVATDRFMRGCARQ